MNFVQLRLCWQVVGTLRLRRLRNSPALRALVSETSVTADDLIQPLFVTEGSGVRRPIASMPGVYNLSLDELEREADTVVAAGIRAVLLFGIPDEKDAVGTQASAENGIVQQAIRRLKARHPELIVIPDVCLCEYTSHGHCGILDACRVLNDPTVERLAAAAVSLARAGADMIAPSDMMDLRVGAIRAALDEAGFPELPIMAYSTKYASALYGPFRDAAQSTPSFGDRKSHQLNPANSREALRQAEADLRQGADILMVKPATLYLDILTRLKERLECPLAAYHVSGEYSMIKAAAASGYVDEPRLVWETLTSIKRAGADLIITYYATEFASGKLRYEY